MRTTVTTLLGAAAFAVVSSLSLSSGVAALDTAEEHVEMHGTLVPGLDQTSTENLVEGVNARQQALAELDDIHAETDRGPR